MQMSVPSFARRQSARYIRGVRASARQPTLVAVLALAALLGPGCARRTKPGVPASDAPQLVVRTIPVRQPQYRPDEYLQPIATRVHVAPPQQSAFWRAVGSYFVSRSTSAILTVGVQINTQNVGVVPLATVKTGSGAV